MMKSALTAFAVVSLISLPSFAAQNRCYEAAAETVQSALKGSPYVMGSLQDESSANGPAIFVAEALLASSHTMAGSFVVVMNPSNCAVQSKRFNDATP